MKHTSIKLMNVKCHKFYFPVIKNCLKMTETYGSDPKIWKQEGTIVQTVYLVCLPWVYTTVATY